MAAASDAPQPQTVAHSEGETAAKFRREPPSSVRRSYLIRPSLTGRLNSALGGGGARLSDTFLANFKLRSFSREPSTIRQLRAASSEFGFESSARVANCGRLLGLLGLLAGHPGELFGAALQIACAAPIAEGPAGKSIMIQFRQEAGASIWPRISLELRAVCPAGLFDSRAGRPRVIQ